MKEKEIQKYMEKLGISREEAEQLWEDDHDGYETPEMKEMERKAKQNKRYEKSETPRKNTPKERKVDEEKKRFLLSMKTLIEGLGGLVTTVKNEAEFSFTYGKNCYTVKLVKHRPNKS